LSFIPIRNRQAAGSSSKNGVGRTRTNDLYELIRSLRNTAENADSITSDVKDNPSRLLFGAPPPKGTPGK
jgi:hypothetical protein